MPSYKLTYWGITGLAESIRQTFALAGIPFEDDIITRDIWSARKEDPAYAGVLMGLPMLEITNDDGTKVSITQSLAIIRYVGRIASFNGKALYPEEPLTQAFCDEVIGIVEDFRPLMGPTFQIQDQAEKEAARKALVTAPDGKMLPGLTKLNDVLARFAFAAGDAPSIADCYVVTICYLFQAPSFLDGFPEDSLAPFTNITALKDKLCSLAPLQKYYKDAVEIRAPFKVEAKEEVTKPADAEEGEPYPDISYGAAMPDRLAGEKMEKKMKKIVKEGGKRGVEIEGAADMGGLQFFCTTLQEPNGDVDMLYESMKAMNAKNDPNEEERKGGSGRIGKMIVSPDQENSKLAMVAYVPPTKHDVLKADQWMKDIMTTLGGGELVFSDATTAKLEIKNDADKGLFVLKLKDNAITESINYLKGKGLFPDSKDDDDSDFVFGDDDFPTA